MSDHVYRVLYCSRNFIEGNANEREIEISQILATARANNGHADVTGALLFTSGYFAQVLEGPRPAVEKIFEKIQRDGRHGDVTVLECGDANERDFPEWGMAYVEPPSQDQAKGLGAALDKAMQNPGAAGSGVLDLLRSLVLQED